MHSTREGRPDAHPSAADRGPLIGRVGVWPISAIIGHVRQSLRQRRPSRSMS
jgi:hypothetical protein